MEVLSNLVGQINSIVWGPVMLVLILGVGFFLQAGFEIHAHLEAGHGFQSAVEGPRRSRRRPDQPLQRPS